jgi:hypothetical protein
MMDVKLVSLEEIEELNKKSLIVPFINDVIKDYKSGKKIPLNEVNV